MSQAPLHQRRSDGDSHSAPGVTDLRSRRKSPQPAKRRRPPLLPFALGIALGYGLAGPLPQLATGAMAALRHGPQQLRG